MDFLEEQKSQVNSTIILMFPATMLISDYVPSIFPSDVVQVRGLERLEPVHPDLGAASQLVSVDTQTDPCLEKDPFQFWWECDFDGGSAATGCALPGNGESGQQLV